MSDTTDPTVCCSTAGTPVIAEERPTGSAPCCGTAKDVADAQGCCAPAVEREARTTRVACC